MNCELAHERIAHWAYGELADDLAPELERHLAGCEPCREERDQVLLIKRIAGFYPVQEPCANLMARCRIRLDEALDAMPPKRWYQRLAERFHNHLARLQEAPLAACLLLGVGIGAGSLAGYAIAERRAAELASSANPAQVGSVVASNAAAQEPNAASSSASSQGLDPILTVAGVSSVVREPNSNLVDVSFNRVVPQHLQGSLDSPQIRQLLMLASQNAASAGLRDDSVGLLAAECRAGHGCARAGIRDALMVALRYDKSAAVRAKALHGLEPYVVDDMRVRDAVLEALLDDAEPSIRSAAIGILQPVEADTSVRQVLSTVANSDQNSHIRTVSRQVLSQVPEIQ